MYVDLCSEVEKICKGKPDQKSNYNSVEVAIVGGSIASPSLITTLRDEFKCKVLVS